MSLTARLACLLFVGLLSVASGLCRAQSVATASLKIVVISDINDAYGATTYGRQVRAAMSYIEKLCPDLVICAGDMVAGQNLKLTEANSRAMWQGFDENILRRLRRLQIPFAFTFGNHDGPDTARYAHERSIAVEYWLRNRPELNYVDDSDFPAQFSFALKDIFFISIDAATASIDNQQREWLKNQLTGKVARSARLRVVIGHLPLYAISEGRNRPGDVLADADALHALLCRSGADYYISGHHHAFYSSKKDNLKMLSMGALGGGPRRLLNCQKPPVKTLTILALSAFDSDFRVSTFAIQNSIKPLCLSDLPAELPGFNGVSQLYKVNLVEAVAKSSLHEDAKVQMQTKQKADK